MLRQSLGSELQLSAEGVFGLYLVLQDIERDIAEAEQLLKKEDIEQ